MRSVPGHPSNARRLAPSRRATTLLSLATLAGGLGACAKAPAPRDPDPVDVALPAPSAPPRFEITQLFAGSDTACALDAEGGLWCWGDVFTGIVPQATRVEGLPAVDEVALAADHACALTREGEIWCWGRDAHDRPVGDPRQPPQVPTPVPGLEGAIDVAVSGGLAHAGAGWSCALDAEGTAWCWQRGRRPTRLRKLTGMSAIAVARDHACGLAGGIISCWTHREFQFHAGAPTIRRLGGAPRLIDLVTDWDTVFGVAEDGRVYGWGPRCGQSRGWKTEPESPCDIGESRAPLAAIAASGWQLCIAREDATRCWVRDPYGKLATAGLERHPPHRRVAVGFGRVCALEGSDEVSCWSRRGLGRPLTTWRPRRYRIPARGPLAIANRSACWVDGQGARCWTSTGYPTAGEPRLTGEWLAGTEGSRSVRTERHEICVAFADRAPRCTSSMDLLTERDDVRDLSFDQHGECAIVAGGGVVCDGFGLGEEVTLDGKPLAGVTALKTRDKAACARTGQRLACWGDGPWPEAPNGRATVIDGLGPVTDFALGRHLLCVVVDGRVACWGRGSHGELGDGMFRYRDEPRFVEGLDEVAAIAAGDHHLCARSVEGALWCWGDNRHGQLGDGTRRSTGRPLRVPDVGVVTAIALGGNNTCAGRGDDSLCWGEDVDGLFASRPPAGEPPATIEGLGRRGKGEATAPTIATVVVTPTDAWR